MNALVLLLSAVVAVAAAESPVYYANFLRFQRVEYRPENEYKLAGRQGYVPPPPLPPAAYGPPTLPTTTETVDVTTTEIPTTTETATEQESEQIMQEDNEKFTEQGVYYIYHPNGLLQRVVYSTKNDVQNMGYTAQLSYKDVEPIKDPIYTYDPETFVLRQIQL